MLMIASVSCCNRAVAVLRIGVFAVVIVVCAGVAEMRLVLVLAVLVPQSVVAAFRGIMSRRTRHDVTSVR